MKNNKIIALLLTGFIIVNLSVISQDQSTYSEENLSRDFLSPKLLSHNDPLQEIEISDDWYQTPCTAPLAETSYSTVIQAMNLTKVLSNPNSRPEVLKIAKFNPEAEKFIIVDYYISRYIWQNLPEEFKKHICEPGDLFRTKILDNEPRLCFNMQFIEGVSLESLIERKSLRNFEQKKSIALQLVWLFAQLHSIDVTHRDVKPRQVIISKSNTAVVLDFGMGYCEKHISTNNSYGDEKLAGFDNDYLPYILGTPGYISPDRIYSLSSDNDYDSKKSEIYSLGVLLYMIFTSRHPLCGDLNNVKTVTIKKIQDNDILPIAPGSICSSTDIESKIEKVLKKALTADLAARYQTMREFAEALEAACNTAHPARLKQLSCFSPINTAA